MQRGLVMTLAASEKSARERAAWSPIVAKVDGARNPPPGAVCANEGSAASDTAQARELKKTIDRIVLGPVKVFLNYNVSVR
jgi:hypothetical protein